mmetsp:Transcript_52862/g.83970  ORF Transcript_52862/g.83970 Transcript_52862/m.83970 type:complete len:96 (-) Transcript_52862:176-463(-)
MQNDARTRTHAHAHHIITQATNYHVPLNLSSCPSPRHQQIESMPTHVARRHDPHITRVADPKQEAANQPLTICHVLCQRIAACPKVGACRISISL